jgi:hypothetical protein
MKKVYIRQDDGDRKLIGTFGEGVFKSNRSMRKHLYRALDAWGIDSIVLKDLHENKGLHTIIIYDSDTKTTYTTDADNFVKNCTYLHHKPHRSQAFLPLGLFTKS